MQKRNLRLSKHPVLVKKIYKIKKRQHKISLLLLFVELSHNNNNKNNNHNNNNNNNNNKNNNNKYIMNVYAFKNFKLLNLILTPPRLMPESKIQLLLILALCWCSKVLKRSHIFSRKSYACKNCSKHFWTLFVLEKIVPQAI
jgi:hypothetical protein